jgi:hypothetical protein
MQILSELLIALTSIVLLLFVSNAFLGTTKSSVSGFHSKVRSRSPGRSAIASRHLVPQYSSRNGTGSSWRVRSAAADCVTSCHAATGASLMTSTAR